MSLSKEAADIAWQSGIKLLGPIAQRVIDLEARATGLENQNRDLKNQIAEGDKQRGILERKVGALETAARNSGKSPHLREVEKR